MQSPIASVIRSVYIL